MSLPISSIDILVKTKPGLIKIKVPPLEIKVPPLKTKVPPLEIKVPPRRDEDIHLACAHPNRNSLWA